MAAQTFPLVWLQSAESAETAGIRVEVWEAPQAANFPLVWLTNDIPRRAGWTAEVLEAEYGEALGQIGGFQFTIPAEIEAAGLMVHGREVRLFVGGEGLVYRGFIERTQEVVAGDRAMLQVSGPSIARTLVRKKLAGARFQGTNLADSVSRLLAGTGWFTGELDTSDLLLQLDAIGQSVWQGIETAAFRFGMYARANVLAQRVDVGAFGTNPSGLVFQNVEQAGPALLENRRLVPLTGLTVLQESEDVVNRVYPLGQTQGIKGEYTTLANTTRTSPYAVGSVVGEDGVRYYYLEDSGSIGRHGLSEEFVSLKDIYPQGLAATDFTRASNALYDAAATWLARRSQALRAYQVSVAGLRHMDAGGPLLRVGDKVRVIFNGIAEDIDGRRAWKSVDEDLYVMAYRRRLQGDGRSTWSITVSSVAREVPSDGSMAADIVRQLKAIESAPLPFFTFAARGGAPAMRLDEWAIQLATRQQNSVGIYGVEEFSENPSALTAVWSLVGKVIQGLGLRQVSLSAGPSSLYIASGVDPVLRLSANNRNVFTGVGQDSVTGRATVSLGDVADFALATASLSIISGVIYPFPTAGSALYTMMAAHLIVDTQSAAATDDLDSIDSTGLTAGRVVVLRAANTARTVVVKDGTGNLRLNGDCSLDDDEQTITLIYNGTNWLEVGRSAPGGGGMKTAGTGFYVLPDGLAGAGGATSSATANTYGSWSQLRAASGNALYIVGVSLWEQGGGTGVNYVQVDLGVGGAGAEVSVGKAYFRVSQGGDQDRIYTLPFPIPVAASARIACRVADNIASSYFHGVALHVVDQVDLVSI